jgi:hypothetical protein
MAGKGIIVVIWGVFISAGCMKEKGQVQLSSSDRILISYFDEPREDVILQNDSAAVNVFQRVLEGREDSCACSTSGEIVFMKGDSILLQAEFATEGTGGENSCLQLIMDKPETRKCYELDEEAGRLLDEHFIELKTRE